MRRRLLLVLCGMRYYPTNCLPHSITQVSRACCWNQCDRRCRHRRHRHNKCASQRSFGNSGVEQRTQCRAR